jgi:predicted transcriptional regulator
MQNLLPMNEILLYLKKHGERSDQDIADATGIPLPEVHIHLAELKANSQIMMCRLTKYVKDKEIESLICRISGFIPPAKPGAKIKSKAQTDLKGSGNETLPD